MELQSKSSIRRFVLEQRENMEMDTRKAFDESIFNLLINSEFYKAATVIFVFVSFGSEINTHSIIEHALKTHRTVYVPKVVSAEKGMEAFRINSLEELKVGYFNILEPQESCPPGDISSIDLILMPGVAFDNKGGRLGYGKGFYDVFLKKINKKVKKIALAYDFQVIDSVPMEEYDVFIDEIVTNEGRLIWK